MVVSDEEDEMDAGIWSVHGSCDLLLMYEDTCIEAKTSEASPTSSPAPEPAPMKFGPPKGKPKKSSKKIESLEPEASEDPQPSKPKAKRLSKKKAASLPVEEDDDLVEDVPPSSDAAISGDEIAKDEAESEEEVEELASGKAARKTYVLASLEIRHSI